MKEGILEFFGIFEAALEVLWVKSCVFCKKVKKSDQIDVICTTINKKYTKLCVRYDY